MDSELIYLNILVNTDAKLHSRLLLDQLKFFEDKESTFNEYFIKPEFQDPKGHVFLKIFVKMKKSGTSQIEKIMSFLLIVKHLLKNQKKNN